MVSAARSEQDPLRHVCEFGADGTGCGDFPRLQPDILWPTVTRPGKRSARLGHGKIIDKAGSRRNRPPTEGRGPQRVGWILIVTLLPHIHQRHRPNKEPIKVTSTRLKVSPGLPPIY